MKSQVGLVRGEKKEDGKRVVLVQVIVLQCTSSCHPLYIIIYDTRQAQQAGMISQPHSFI
jgi:hypothetical protein